MTTDFRTSDGVAVDYVRLASSVDGVLALHAGSTPTDLTAALQRARAHRGLSLVYVPVYYGTDPAGGMGAYGRWNVGNWVDDVEADYRNSRL